MPDHKGLTYQNCLSFLDTLGKELGFVPGQDPEITKQQLEKFFPVGHIADADLVDMMRAVDHTYMVTEQDQAERQTRRALSEKARKNLFELTHNRITLCSALKNIQTRGLDALLDDSGTEAANAFNEKVAQAFARDGDGKFTSTIEERTEVMEQFIDRISNQDYSDLSTLTDEQVVERFPKLYSAYLMSAEAGNMLSDNLDDEHPKNDYYKLSAEHVKKLAGFAQYQGIFGEIKARYDFIMSPGYELCHVERLVPPNQDYLPANAYDDRSPYKVVRNSMKTKTVGDETDIPVYPAEYNLASAISNIFVLEPFGWPDKAKHFARAKGIAPENVEFTKVDGSKFDIDEPNSMIGVGVFRMTDTKTGKTYALKSDNFNLTEVDSKNAVNMVNEASASVMTAMDAADPWYIRIFTGSRQFNEMKKAQEAVLKLRNEMDKNPSKSPSNEQLDRMKTALEKLAEKADRYVQYKYAQYTEGTGPDAKLVIPPDMKDSELTRIRAARIALTCANDNRLLLETYAESLGMEKVETKEKNSLVTRAQHYYASKDPVNPIDQLGNQIYDSLKAFKDNLPEEPIDVIAKMVAYDLVMRERKLNEDGGTVEQAYCNDSETFLKSLKETNKLQEFVKDMSTERFRQFMSDAIGITGISTLSVNITWELREKLQQNQQEQLQQNQQPQMETDIQNQPKKPEPPKQSQSSISMK